MSLSLIQALSTTAATVRVCEITIREDYVSTEASDLAIACDIPADVFTSGFRYTASGLDSGNRPILLATANTAYSVPPFDSEKLLGSLTKSPSWPLYGVGFELLSNAIPLFRLRASTTSDLTWLDGGILSQDVDEDFDVYAVSLDACGVPLPPYSVAGDTVTLYDFNVGPAQTVLSGNASSAFASPNAQGLVTFSTPLVPILTGSGAATSLQAQALLLPPGFYGSPSTCTFYSPLHSGPAPAGWDVYSMLDMGFSPDGRNWATITRVTPAPRPLFFAVLVPEASSDVSEVSGVSESRVVPLWRRFPVLSPSLVPGTGVTSSFVFPVSVGKHGDRRNVSVSGNDIFTGFSLVGGVLPTLSAASVPMRPPQLRALDQSSDGWTASLGAWLVYASTSHAGQALTDSGVVLDDGSAVGASVTRLHLPPVSLSATVNYIDASGGITPPVSSTRAVLPSLFSDTFSSSKGSNSSVGARLLQLLSLMLSGASDPLLLSSSLPYSGIPVLSSEYGLSLSDEPRTCMWKLCQALASFFNSPVQRTSFLSDLNTKFGGLFGLFSGTDSDLRSAFLSYVASKYDAVRPLSFVVIADFGFECLIPGESRLVRLDNVPILLRVVAPLSLPSPSNLVLAPFWSPQPPVTQATVAWAGSLVPSAISSSPSVTCIQRLASDGASAFCLANCRGPSDLLGTALAATAIGPSSTFLPSLVKLSPSGTAVWSVALCPAPSTPSISSSWGLSLACSSSPRGSVYVGGAGFVAKVRASDGVIQWITRSENTRVAGSLTELADGSLVVAGWATSASGLFEIQAFDPTGLLQWTVSLSVPSLPGSPGTCSMFVTASPDGSFFVSGSFSGAGLVFHHADGSAFQTSGGARMLLPPANAMTVQYGSFVARISVTGTVQWVAPIRYATVTPNDSPVCPVLDVSSSDSTDGGCLYVVGRTGLSISYLLMYDVEGILLKSCARTGSGGDGWVYKMSAAGQPLWTSMFSCSGGAVVACSVVALPGLSGVVVASHRRGGEGDPLVVRSGSHPGDTPTTLAFHRTLASDVVAVVACFSTAGTVLCLSHVEGTAGASESGDVPLWSPPVPQFGAENVLSWWTGFPVVCPWPDPISLGFALAVPFGPAGPATCLSTDMARPVLSVHAPSTGAAFGSTGSVLTRWSLTSDPLDPSSSNASQTLNTALLRKYPPAPLTSNVTLLTGQQYGNGLYSATSSSSDANSSLCRLAFDASALTFASIGSISAYVPSTGGYVGSTATSFWAATSAIASDPNLVDGEYLTLALPEAVYLASYSLTGANAASFVLLGQTVASPRWVLLDSRQAVQWTHSPPNADVLQFEVTSARGIPINAIRLVVRAVRKGDTQATFTGVDGFASVFPI